MTHAQTTSTTTAPLVHDTDAGYLGLIAQLGGQVVEFGTGNGASAREVQA